MDDCDCIVCDTISNKKIMNCVRYASVDKAGNRVAVLQNELFTIETNYKRVVDHIKDMKFELLKIVTANHKMMRGIEKMQTEIKEMTTRNSKLTEQNKQLAVFKSNNQQLESQCKDYKAQLNKLRMQSDKEAKELRIKNQSLFKRFRELKDQDDDGVIQSPPPYQEPP